MLRNLAFLLGTYLLWKALTLHVLK